MRIVVLDGYTVNPGDNSWEPVARLGELAVFDRTRLDQIVARARDAEILLTNKTRLDAATLTALPALRFVSVLATGYDVVDVAAARARGIPVSNVPEYGTDSVAQHTFALLLELANHPAEHAAAVAAGEWSRSADFCFWRAAPVELAGRTIGIVGLGRIGRRVADIARAFAMNVTVSGEDSARGGEVARRPLPRLFSESDVVSLHCPLTAKNARFVNRDLLRRMKPSAFFLNTARGGLVDEAALREALDCGWLAGAALDVGSTEPLDPRSPLLGARNLLLTPHMAWASLPARRRLVEVTARNVEAFLGGAPINAVG
ncbi:MAG: D-2-hydroxyacid dehydrogenase [Deltaproteobacteria bacterium]|nr:D-2-hydroxyacid dehydrogenase [Deltaproteobacteria bacterium]